MTSAWRKGRIDAVVQSTDKNFMVSLCKNEPTCYDACTSAALQRPFNSLPDSCRFPLAGRW